MLRAGCHPSALSTLTRKPDVTESSALSAAKKLWAMDASGAEGLKFLATAPEQHVHAHASVRAHVRARPPAL